MTFYCKKAFDFYSPLYVEKGSQCLPPQRNRQAKRGKYKEEPCN
jgi:hypothetical protein